MNDEMSADELRWDEQAVAAAGAVLDEAVEAATRCNQLTIDMNVKAVGMGTGMQKMAKFGEKQGRFMSKLMPGMKGVSDMRTGGLPNSFVIAVTGSKVHAIQSKEKKGGDLTCGNVLSTWDRNGFQAKRGIDIAAQAQGVPADRQILTLYLPNQMTSKMMPGIGQPTQFVVGRDPASEALVSALAG
jgi:hypothetical protein